MNLAPSYRWPEMAVRVPCGQATLSGRGPGAEGRWDAGPQCRWTEQGKMVTPKGLTGPVSNKEVKVVCLCQPRRYNQRSSDRDAGDVTGAGTDGPGLSWNGILDYGKGGGRHLGGWAGFLVPSDPPKSVLIPLHFNLIEWILVLCSETQNRVISNDTSLSFRHFLKHFGYFDHVLFSYFKVNSPNLHSLS